jgi:threonylcarbamoyladenosine tRNA methylthiotransferase MtaB
MPAAKTIAFHTLGCKLNFSETSALSRMLETEGFEKKGFEEQADVYVINTCSVTENADRECRQIVRRIRRKTSDATVVITGCYAQLKPKEIAEIPGVDLVLGAAEKFNMAAHLRDFTRGDSAKICSCDVSDIEDFHPSYSVDDRTRSFLKVQDGCDYTCSFCTIPMARGGSRSNTIANVVSQARMLAEKGVREIVLTGVNLGDFGKGGAGERNGTEDFEGLCKALDAVEEIDRFRISSIEPNLLTPGIIELVARSKRFMPHFHIPLQSGSDRILGLMRRRYRRELYAARIAEIKQQIPHCAVGVDVITGFPSESDADFSETFNFLQELDVSYLHVFTYSERDQTKALEIKPVVPLAVRQERTRILRNLSFMKLRHFTEQHQGQTRTVLFEHRDRNGMMEGYTDNYIKVSTPFRAEWVNSLVEWKL